MIHMVVYTLDLPHTAVARLRVLQPQEHFPEEVQVSWPVQNDGRRYIIDNSLARNADLVLMQKFFPSQETWPLVQQLLSSPTPVVYELDDDFLALPATADAAQRRTWMERLCSAADHVSVSTRHLAARIRRLNANVRVLRNCIDLRLWKPPPAYRAPRRTPGVRIAVTGTTSHASDLEMLREVLQQLAGKYKGAVEFVFFGVAPSWVESLPSATVVPFEYNYRLYAKKLRRLDIDLALVPLDDTPFNRSKSAIKFLEYGASGIPAIYSAVTPYEETVEHGVTGILTPNDCASWLEAVETLVHDAQLRREMGEKARTRVQKRSAAGPCGRNFVDFWRQAAREAWG